MSDEAASIHEISTRFPTVPLKYGVDRRTNKFDEVPEDLPRVSLNMVESWTGEVVRNGEDDEEASTGLVEFQEGDILINKLRPYLAKGFKGKGRGAASPEFLVLQPTKFDAEYLLYLLLSKEFIDRVDASTYGAKMPRASWDFVGSVTVPCPAEPEQATIASYLNEQTACIDRLLGRKERLLNLMEEKRRALVKRTVTEGLNPDVEMVDSKTDWLGEIPKDWGVWRVSHIANVGNGATPKRENQDYWQGGSVPWLTSSVVNQREVKSAEELVTPTAVQECHLPMVEPKSVLVGLTGQGKTRGKATVLKIESTINQHLAYLSPRKDSVDADYLKWVLEAAYAELRRLSSSSGSTRGAITCRDLRRFKIPKIPLSEQRAIATYLQQSASKINQVQEMAEKGIAILQEKRQALITKAVTGQIDLSDWQPPDEQTPTP